MQWLSDHWVILMGAILALSESLAAICQMIWPDNKGVSGVFAAIIKILQTLKGGAKPE